MSKGPGRVEQIIETIFRAEPDNGFTIEDLCERVYSDSIDSYEGRVEKKHRVAVVRAAKQVAKRLRHIQIEKGFGKTLVVFNRYSVLSYAIARIKGDPMRRYRKRTGYWSTDEAKIRARLALGGEDHELVIPGGPWWRFVEEWTAERDGDVQKVARLKAEREEILAKLGMS
jgi:hypothetical protein